LGGSRKRRSLSGCCLRRPEVVGEGRQLGRLGADRYGNAGVAWRGAEALPSVGPARTATAMSKALSPSARPLPVPGTEGGGLAGPVDPHVRKKRRHHPLGVAVRIGQPGQTGGGTGDAADPLAVAVPIGGRRSGVHGIQFRFGVRRVEEQGAQHCLADAAHLSLRGVAVEADPRPQGDPGTAEGGVGELQRDGGHIAAGEGVAGRVSERLGGVAPFGQALEEPADGDAVAVEGIRGQPGPGQPIVAEGEHRTGAALAQQCPRRAVAGSGAAGAEHPNLLLPAFVGLGEGDAESEVLAGATVAGHDEFVEGVGSKGCRGGASGVGVDEVVLHGMGPLHLFQRSYRPVPWKPMVSPARHAFVTQVEWGRRLRSGRLLFTARVERR
jgi:hypothetical protein